MKKISQAVVLAGALAGGGSVWADWFDCFCPFMGIDFYEAWMKPQNDWELIFPKAYPGVTLYLGGRFCDNIGFEIGYDTSSRKSRHWELNRSMTVFRGTPGILLRGDTKIRRSGAHFDLIGYWPLVECFELFGTIGVGWVQASINSSINNISDPVASALVTTSVKGRTLLRLGLGVNYMLTDTIGVRFKGGYETTSSLRARGNNAFTNLGFNTKPFKGTGTLAAGLFYRF